MDDRDWGFLAVRAVIVEGIETRAPLIRNESINHILRNTLFFFAAKQHHILWHIFRMMQVSDVNCSLANH